MRASCDKLAFALAAHPVARLFPSWAQEGILAHGELRSGPPGTVVQPDNQVHLICEGVIAAVGETGPCVGLYGGGAVLGLDTAFAGLTSLSRLEAIIHATWISVPAGVFRSATRPFWLERMYAFQSIGRQKWLSNELACASQHTVSGRLARWLLHIHDLTERADRVPVTQHQQARLLGVQRTTINAMMASLAAQRVIRIGRGYVTRIDRQGLADAACPCHQSDRGRERSVPSMTVDKSPDRMQVLAS
jgi:CRP-like cAMP-binding protein